MRLSTAVTILSAALAPAAASVLEKRSVGDDVKVPGDSPLEFCSPDHSDDILTIESVDLVPNPPQA